MAIKIFFWVLTILGLLPVLLFLALFLRVFVASDMSLRSLMDSRSWSAQANIYQTGNRFANPGNGREIKLYPRLWVLGLGVTGAICLLFFAVYTLHVPYPKG